MSKMRSIEAIAADLLKCGVSWEPTACLVGNVAALEVVRLAATHITSCPKCGAEPWVNIDCPVCAIGNVCEALEEQGAAEGEVAGG